MRYEEDHPFTYGHVTRYNNASADSELVRRGVNELARHVDDHPFVLPDCFGRRSVQWICGRDDDHVEIIPYDNDEKETAEDNVLKNNSVAGFTQLVATDTQSRLSGVINCPTHPGAHYHLTEFAANNTVIDKYWLAGMVLLDDTSKHNPYDPAAYNGDNNIQLGH